MIRFYAIIGIVLYMIIYPAVSNALEVGVVTNSYHFDRNKEVSETNPGITVKYKSMFAAVFSNSYSDTTSMIGVYQESKFNSYVSTTIAVGLVKGYSYGKGGYMAEDSEDAEETGVLPYILPTVTIRAGDWGLNTHFLWDGFAWSISRKF